MYQKKTIQTVIIFNIYLIINIIEVPGGKLEPEESFSRGTEGEVLEETELEVVFRDDTPFYMAICGSSKPPRCAAAAAGATAAASRRPNPSARAGLSVHETCSAKRSHHR